MLTRLGLYGGPRPLYGDFSAKGAPAGKSPGHITRLALYGAMRPRYGSFAGKVLQPPGETIPQFEGLRRNVGRMMR